MVSAGRCSGSKERTIPSPSPPRSAASPRAGSPSSRRAPTLSFPSGNDGELDSLPERAALGKRSESAAQVLFECLGPLAKNSLRRERRRIEVAQDVVHGPVVFGDDIEGPDGIEARLLQHFLMKLALLEDPAACSAFGSEPFLDRRDGGLFPLLHAIPDTAAGDEHQAAACLEAAIHQLGHAFPVGPVK